MGICESVLWGLAFWWLKCCGPGWPESLNQISWFRESIRAKRKILGAPNRSFQKRPWEWTEGLNNYLLPEEPWTENPKSGTLDLKPEPWCKIKAFFQCSSKEQ